MGETPSGEGNLYLNWITERRLLILCCFQYSRVKTLTQYSLMLKIKKNKSLRTKEPNVWNYFVPWYNLPWWTFLWLPPVSGLRFLLHSGRYTIENSLTWDSCWYALLYLRLGSGQLESLLRFRTYCESKVGHSLRSCLLGHFSTGLMTYTYTRQFTVSS